MPWLVEDLRICVAEFMREHEAFLAGMQEPGKTFTQECDEVEATNKWGEESTVFALAHILNRPTRVWTSFPLLEFLDYIPENVDKQKQPFELVHLPNGHYRAVLSNKTSHFLVHHCSLPPSLPPSLSRPLTRESLACLGEVDSNHKQMVACLDCCSARRACLSRYVAHRSIALQTRACPCFFVPSLVVQLRASLAGAAPAE